MGMALIAEVKKLLNAEKAKQDRKNNQSDDKNAK